MVSLHQDYIFAVSSKSFSGEVGMAFQCLVDWNTSCAVFGCSLAMIWSRSALWSTGGPALSSPGSWAVCSGSAGSLVSHPQHETVERAKEESSSSWVGVETSVRGLALAGTLVFVVVAQMACFQRCQKNEDCLV